MDTATRAAQIALQDQADAKEREWERRAATVALFLLWVFFSLGVYFALAAKGYVPAAPWSPIGKYQHHQYRQPAPVVQDTRPV